MWLTFDELDKATDIGSIGKLMRLLGQQRCGAYGSILARVLHA